MSLDFFYSEKYLKFIEDVLNIEISSIKINNTNAMHYASKHGSLGTVINSLPFFGSFGGPLYKTPSDLKIINDQLNTIIADSDPFSFLVVENPFYPIDSNLVKRFVEVDNRIFQYSELPNNSDILINLVEPSTRRNIKKSMRNNIKVSFSDPSYEFNMKWHKISMERKNVKTKPESFYQKLNDHFEYGKEYAIYHAYMENEKIASLLIFYCNKSVEYFIPAYNPDFLNLEPMSLIIYQAMIDAIDKGYKTWNWGGIHPNAKSVYKFKKKWFTKELPYRYLMYLKDSNNFKLSSNHTNEYGFFYFFPYSKLMENVV